jgi:hypothetical protein
VVIDEIERAGFGCVNEGATDERLGFGANGRRRDRGTAVRLQVYMRDTADVPELEEDSPACGVHAIGHDAPALHLRVGIDAGCVLIWRY